MKYPDNMSSNFRSFLRGLLIKDPHNRLTWPHLLQHSFVAETFEDVEAKKELRANTAADRVGDAAWKEERHVQATDMTSASPEAKIRSPTTTNESSKTPGYQTDSRSNDQHPAIVCSSPQIESQRAQKVIMYIVRSGRLQTNLNSFLCITSS